jgi:hypothetical protein
LGVVIPFQSSKLARQLFVRGEHSAQTDKGPHDFDVNLYGTLALKDGREHSHALLGEGIWS